MDRLSRGSSSSSHRIKKSVISDEKSLKDWKLPASSASDIYNKRTGIFSTVRTVEKELRLSESSASFPLFSKKFQRFYKKCFGLLHVGMIQVALKPTKLGSNTTAVICLRDNRMQKYEDSILKKVKSNLRDGPIYFSYFPTHFIATGDAHDTFTIALLTKKSSTMRSGESVVLMFRFHYKLVKSDNVLLDMKYLSVSKSLANAAQRNSPSSDGGEEEDAVANARVDWRETAEAHVLKVDVPGLKKEEVKVEVEDDGCTLNISGERSNEQEENGDMWHCVERSSGTFLRRVTLPENAKLDEVKAAMENGVLTVTVPKEKVKKKTQVKVIEISG